MRKWKPVTRSSTVTETKIASAIQAATDKYFASALASTARTKASSAEPHAGDETANQDVPSDDSARQAAAAAAVETLHVAFRNASRGLASQIVRKSSQYRISSDDTTHCNIKNVDIQWDEEDESVTLTLEYWPFVRPAQGRGNDLPLRGVRCTRQGSWS